MVSSSPPGLDTAQHQTQAVQFLQCHLSGDTNILLSVQHIREVLTIPQGQVIPLPHLPPWVMGVYNWRGDVLWMVDLSHLVGLTPWHQQARTIGRFSAVVIGPRTSRTTTGAVGLVVNQVHEMEWVNPDLIQSPPASAITPGLLPFLRGYWLKPSGDIFVCLQGDAILAAMPSA